jgi:tetratricopeptide (TPR) repeat protein
MGGLSKRDSRQQMRPQEEMRPVERRGRRRVLLAAVILLAGLVALWAWRRLPRVEHQSHLAAPEVSAQQKPEPHPRQAEQVLPGLDGPPPASLPEMMDEAKQVVGRLVERFPQDPLALDCAAKAYLYLGDTNQAADYWNRCVRLDPEAAFAWEGLGRIAVMKSDYAQAAERFQQALDHCPASVDHTWRADCACQLGDVLMKLGRIEEAIHVLEKYALGSPESAKSQLLLGQLYLQAQDYEQAKQHFETVLRIQPESRQAHFGLATALTRTGEAAKGREHMSRFQALYARRAETRAAMRFQDEELKELVVKVSMTHTHCGQVYQRHGDLHMAQRHWQRAGLLSPENATCRVELADLYAQTRRPREALTIYRSLVARDPANPLFQWQAGRLCLELGDFEAAQPHLQALIEIAPDRAEGYAALAALHLESGANPTAARRMAQEAVRIEPNQRHYVLLSRACAALGDVEGARRAAAKAAAGGNLRSDTAGP